ncbi:unnamed protein product [Ilex paraguariensis]|uniref:Uncharacterized protein n=1 Tax=Ilex paraguariensis TaxID=185542 RepID=A0ABC8T8A0_9AQUA
MEPTTFKARPGCRSGSNINIELPKARVNAKVNQMGQRSLTLMLYLEAIQEIWEKQGRHMNKQKRWQMIPSGEASKNLVDVDVLPEDKKNLTKDQPNLLEAQQKQPRPRAPRNQDVGRITSKNKLVGLNLEGGEIIVDLASETEASTSIYNEGTKEKEKANGNKHPLGSKNKKAKKKDHEMGKSKVTEHLSFRKVLSPQLSLHAGTFEELTSPQSRKKPGS